MKQSNVRRVVVGVTACLVLVSPYAFGAGDEGLSKTGPMVRIMPSGDSLELIFPEDSGTPVKETIPIHRVGSIRYFSAGIGIEERSVHYPSFPLKLVFVTGPKAYLTLVSVTITDREGKVHLQIPSKQVAGPWLFLDLPPGNYDISAEGPGKVSIKEQVTLSNKETKTLYLRWKEETA
jgi:hypothetical protein